MPSRRLMSRNASITSLAFIGSSEAIGSSASSRRGSCINARAIATRCCCPPDNASARFSARSAMPSRSSARIASARSRAVNSLNSARAVGMWFSRPASTLVSTSSRGTRLNCWKIIAALARQACSARPCRPVMSRPSNSTRPSLGSISRLTMRSSVDLPAPERPMMPTIWPPGIASVTSATATRSPKRRVTLVQFQHSAPIDRPRRT